MGRYRVWVILLVVVISISKSVLAGGADYLEKYDLMSTNDYLELYLNRETTELQSGIKPQSRSGLPILHRETD